MYAPPIFRKTAGSLGPLPARPSEPMIVMNGDLLTKVDFHHQQGFVATMVMYQL